MNFPTKLHLKPPFRVEHVGSLVRPPSLYEKRALFEEHKCTQEDLKAVEDEAIIYVVNLQRDLGLKTITDGEFRRLTLRDCFMTPRFC